MDHFDFYTKLMQIVGEPKVRELFLNFQEKRGKPILDRDYIKVARRGLAMKYLVEEKNQWLSTKDENLIDLMNCDLSVFQNILNTQTATYGSRKIRKKIKDKPFSKDAIEYRILLALREIGKLRCQSGANNPIEPITNNTMENNTNNTQNKAVEHTQPVQSEFFQDVPETKSQEPANTDVYTMNLIKLPKFEWNSIVEISGEDNKINVVQITARILEQRTEIRKVNGKKTPVNMEYWSYRYKKVDKLMEVANSDVITEDSLIKRVNWAKKLKEKESAELAKKNKTSNVKMVSPSNTSNSKVVNKTELTEQEITDMRNEMKELKDTVQKLTNVLLEAKPTTVS